MNTDLSLPRIPLKEATAPALPSRSVALVGTYPPRRCGIATFTQDLAGALSGGGELDVRVVAVNDVPEGYPYDDEVRFDINQKVLHDYRQAADYLNIADELRNGVELTKTQFYQVLQTVGVEPIAADQGTSFDPKQHEAVFRDEHSDLPSNTIAHLVQSGFWYRGRLLRPARVVVAAGKKRDEVQPSGQGTDSPTDADATEVAAAEQGQQAPAEQARQQE